MSELKLRPPWEYDAGTMTEIKREEERERLTRCYAGMAEEELKEIAKREGSLTDVAREVIRAELSRRALKVEQEVEQSEHEVGQEESPELIAGDSATKLTKIRQFTFVPDALVAKSVLDSEGVKCFLSDETTIRMDWLWSNALGGVKLWVREEDVETALELLKEEGSRETDG